MKTLSSAAKYFELRAKYKNAKEIGEIINRSETYVKLRMTDTGKDFTEREKRLLNLED